jgi:hypothetical protein
MAKELLLGKRSRLKSDRGAHTTVQVKKTETNRSRDYENYSID